MSLELCILASGSAGNAAVVRSPAGAMLIDAGIGPRTCAKRLEGTGVRLADIRAICFTHLDRDHCSANWARTICNNGIRLYAHRQIAPEVEELLEASALVTHFDQASFEPLDGVQFRPIPLAHDQEGSHGFLIEGYGCRMGYATDLGHVPEHLLELFGELDLLALESNYDIQMQQSSTRPWFLKQRIMGGKGHLSNEQAFAAIRQILDRAQSLRQKLPSHIVLLHRSRECNCPRLLRDLFGRDQRIASRLTLAEQYQRSEWLRKRDVAPSLGEQLTMAWA